MITQKRKREELQLLRDEALDAYMNREDFQYDVNADALYRYYKDQYTQLGKRAMQDTMGQASALTGGYGSSYAQNVGQQAYQSHLEQLGDVVPALYQLAYDRYQDQGDKLYKTYESWAELEQQAAQQEQWEREYELEERKRQDAHNRFLLEQEYKNSQTQTSQTQTGTSQPDYWAMLARHQKLGLNTQSQETTSEKAQTANTPVTMTKTQQTEQFVANTDSWETVARSGNGYENYEEYLKTRIDSALSKGHLTSGEAAWLISYYTPQIGESTDDQYTSDRFKQLQKQVKAQMATDVDESYIQSFVSDSQEFVLQTEEDIRALTWSTATSEEVLDKRNASAQAIKDRANKVRAWLDANKSRISQDAYQQYIQYLDNFSVFLDQSADAYKKSRAAFSRFATEEDYNKAVARQQWQIKYGNMNYTQIKTALASLPDGEEREWLLAYAAGIPKTLEDIQQELAWAKDQYQYLIQMQNKSAELEELKSNLEAATPGAPGYAELEKQYENMLKQYPSTSIFEDLDGQITAVEEKIGELEKDLDIAKMADVVNEADFDTYKGYVSTKSDTWWDTRNSKGMDYSDLKYEWINGAENGMRRAIEAAAANQGESGYNSDTYQWRIYRYITPDEISIYNYHYAKYGKEEAEKYLDSINSTLESRYNNVSEQEAKEYASDAPFEASVATVLGTLGSVPEYLGDVLNYASEKLEGNEYASIGYNEFALVNSTIRGTVAEQVNWKIGNWDAFDFLYNTVMSSADSLVAGTMLGNLGGLALGISAAAQGTNDALNRGMNSGQAFWSGLFSGAFECIFESVSIGQFNSLKEVAPESVKDILKNLAKSMLVNASEETLTEIANIAYDTLVNGEFANYTLEELKNGAWKNALWQVLESGASGLLIGSGMSTVASTSAYVNQQAQNYKTGKTIKSTDGGLDALINSANEVMSVSSEQMQNALTSQIDKVSQNPTARNVGQLYATVQAANNQANTVVNQEDVAKRLLEKGFYSKEAADVAEAVAARLNEQDLTRTQKYILSSALNSSAVRDTISEFIKKKVAEVDSEQNRIYDRGDIGDGPADEGKAALWDLAYQRAGRDRSGGPGVLREIGSMPPETFSSAQRRGLTSEVDVFGDNDYATVMGGSSLYQVQNAFSKRNYESGTDVLDEIKRTGEIVVEFNYNSKYDKIEFARQLADQQKGMKELTVQEYLDNRRKYIEQGRAIGSNAAQQAAREKAFADKVDELQDAGLSLKEAEEQARKWLDTQAALHIPDQVAGGYSGNVGGVGDKGVNSSIGAQWRYRISGVDAQIQKMAESMSEAEKNTTYLNVSLIFKGE